MKMDESTAFASLIVTIITSVVFPLINIPAITFGVEDVSSSDARGMREYKITIFNYGLHSAHDVVVSAEVANGRIASLKSVPYLSAGYIVDGSTLENIGFAKLSVLPPRGQVDLYLSFETSSRIYQAPNVYVSSNEAHGRPNWESFLIVLCMAAFIIAASIAIYHLWRKFIYPRAPA